jgi:Ca2+-binding RTX toxin-like protein
VAAGPVDQVGDTVAGGNGNDTIRTRDGEVDRVTCGAGRDRALLDQVDVISDATAENPKGSCEVVKRLAPSAADSSPEDAQESPAEGNASS